MAVITDPIADMLTRIRNAARARHPRVDMPPSKLKVEIARVLKEEGYVGSFKLTDEGGRKVLRIVLRYDDGGKSAITKLYRISRPGRRVFVSALEIPKVLGGLGVNILTTPRGVMSGKAARRARVGGELLCGVE